MAYLRGTLSVLAAIFIALLEPAIVVAIRNASQTKAIGMAAVTGGLLERLLSPLFWILVILFSALFFAASRLSSSPLRIVLFWGPVTTISTLGFGLMALFTYMWLHFRSGKG